MFIFYKVLHPSVLGKEQKIRTIRKGSYILDHPKKNSFYVLRDPMQSYFSFPYQDWQLELVTRRVGLIQAEGSSKMGKVDIHLKKEDF